MKGLTKQSEVMGNVMYMNKTQGNKTMTQTK